MMVKRKVEKDPTLADWLGDDLKQLPPHELAEALDVLYAAGPDQAQSRRARVALEKVLKQELPPKVHYALLPDSDLGKVWVAVSGSRLVGIDYVETEEEFLAFLQKLFKKGRFEHSEEKMARALEDLRAYLKGERQQFSLWVDLSRITDFQRRVLEETAKVPRGQVVTYADIARRIGQPKAVRAVGQALRRNPIPIVVPCHRVVNSNGDLGGYGGRMGDERKIKLLKLEGVVFA